jgi:hypothetical protein
MCRNIKKLRRPGEIPSDAEMRDAALQFVRKISGYRVPSQTNQEAFEKAVSDVTDAARGLFQRLGHKSAD